MNELVQLTTQDVSKAIPITTSLIVAEKYEVKHKSVIDLIVRYKEDFEQLGKLMRLEIVPVEKISQRNETYFELNEEQFYLLVTYMKNTEIARKYKIEFVKQFSIMKKELLARSETRHIGKYARKSLTDSIKTNLSEGNFKKYAYGKYTKIIYKKLFGKDAKTLKAERKVPENKNLRDYFTIQELTVIQDIESQIATIIEYSDEDDKKTYEKIQNFLNNKKNILSGY